ncbi:MAG: PbpA [Desulfobacterales bacterium]|nr:PbpA [Desulfobacterales bacterium]
MAYSGKNINNWRDYQDLLSKSRVKEKPNNRIGLYVLLLLTVLIIWHFDDSENEVDNVIKENKRNEEILSIKNDNQLDIIKIKKTEIHNILNGQNFLNITEKNLAVTFQDKKYVLETNIDVNLQNYALKKLDTATAKYIAIVGMDPITGKIFLMSGFSKTDEIENPCIANIFPAASLFKIITAAAAIEKCRLDPDSELFYNGRKYTLYKSQLNEKKNKYTYSVSFMNAFAKSINPVFGKIGSLKVGKDNLELYAKKFGFNSPIRFDLPVPNSTVDISDSTFALAEIASGFNKKTVISPLHGVLLSSSVANSGIMVEPAFINKITNENNDVIYEFHKTNINKPISNDSAQKLKKLMIATINSGTCRKIFRGYRKDKILSQLVIGGKTGSINDSKYDSIRYDWFVGFAEKKDGTNTIALSVLVAHEKYIGVKAGQYARMIIKEFFSNQN